MGDIEQGDGWATAHLGDLGDGPGFRKVRTALGVEEMGINAVVMPPGVESGFHFHERQEEVYFVHSGVLEMEFGDGSVQVLGPGSIARVGAATHRKTRNRGPEEVVYVVVGAEGGYVGRDGRAPEGDPGPRVRPIDG